MSARFLPAALLITAAALGLTACAGPAAPAPAASTAAPSVTAAEFPRTIEVPAARGGEATTLTLESAPTRIAALDYESAEVLAELGLAKQLVLVPEAVTNPTLGGHVEEMAQVATTFPVAMALEAETVISLDPELVVMSPRHGAEDTIGSVLMQSGIPTLQLPDSWTDLAHLSSNIALIGQSTATEEAAETLVSTLERGLEPTTTPNKSRVLVLSNQAGRAFVTAGNAFPLRLLELAGAQDVSAELGIVTTGPISAEQLVQADPDGILLIDMNGSGERMFAELLENPAVAALPGAQRTLLLPGKDVQAMGLTNTISGLEQLEAWLAEK
ncbi:periplasmic binding protein [Leucobacter sp. 7(1)]|uniref:ABC transporter substrate-binding protein n=1 Tax=Leucobacter sp. 7(1) TaxID=1255613 RepID=UPI00097ED01C|nr:ABC transporter substrate-binding protein [Leucobacter sp. 7(1)]SJN08219.1 periplasmic binding protein [Leucobacter sp. 7(1)]